MPGAPFDATSYERELARLAYSRPMDGVDPTAAQAELAALAEARLPPPETEWHPLNLATPATRREKLLLLAAVGAALFAATAVAITPVASLSIFDVPQAGVPAWPSGVVQDERTDRIRWLASSNGWDVFGFITTGGNICLASFEGAVSAGGVCTSQEVFAIIGLRMGMNRPSGTSTEYLSVKWGPTGGARLADIPLAAWSD